MDSSTNVRILAPRYGGDFGTSAGLALPFVLSGELVDGASHAVLEPSADRVAPRCVHFGVCGGCQYQHAGTQAQLQMKLEILAGILAEGGLRELPAMGVSSAEPWEYRNRIRLRVERAGTAFAVGYSRRGSNEFLPICMCPIAAPLLWSAAQAVLTLGDRWLGLVSEVELFANDAQTALQVRFFLREPDGSRLFDGVCERLREQIPELVGAGSEADPELSRSVRRRWQGAAWGAPGMRYSLPGSEYWVTRGAFFQVNRHLVGRLVELVTAGESGKLAWDLFAGVGLFTQPLARQFERVIAVEGADAAAADLATASRDGKLFQAVPSSTVDFLRAKALERERPELIVADPPRVGLGAEAAELLARIRAERMVYVSCDPTYLARDLAILTREAYRIAAIELVDLFPQTFHIETVVRLVRR